MQGPSNLLSRLLERFGGAVSLTRTRDGLRCSSCPGFPPFKIRSSSKFDLVVCNILKHQDSLGHTTMAGKKTLTHFGITTTKGMGLIPGIKRHDLTEQCYGYHRPTIRVKGHEINVKGYMEAQSHPAGVSCSKAERRSFLNAAGEKLSYVGTHRTDGCSGLATDAFGKSNGENCCHLCFAGVRSDHL